MPSKSLLYSSGSGIRERTTSWTTEKNTTSPWDGQLDRTTSWDAQKTTSVQTSVDFSENVSRSTEKTVSRTTSTNTTYTSTTYYQNHILSNTPILPYGPHDTAMDSTGRYVVVTHIGTSFFSVIDTNDWSVVTNNTSLFNPTTSVTEVCVRYLPNKDKYAFYVHGEGLHIVDPSTNWQTPTIVETITNNDFPQYASVFNTGKLNNIFLEVSSSGRYMVLISKNLQSVCRVVDTTDWSIVLEHQTNEYINCVDFSPDESMVVFGHYSSSALDEPSVYVINLMTGMYVKTMEHGDIGVSGRVYRVSFSPDGQTLLVHSRWRGIVAFSTNNWSYITGLEWWDSPLDSDGQITQKIAWSPDSNYFALWVTQRYTEGNKVMIVDANAWEPVQETVGISYNNVTAVFTKDSTKLVIPHGYFHLKLVDESGVRSTKQHFLVLKKPFYIAKKANLYRTTSKSTSVTQQITTSWTTALTSTWTTSWNYTVATQRSTVLDNIYTTSWNTAKATQFNDISTSRQTSYLSTWTVTESYGTYKHTFYGRLRNSFYDLADLTPGDYELHMEYDAKYGGPVTFRITHDGTGFTNLQSLYDGFILRSDNRATYFRYLGEAQLKHVDYDNLMDQGVPMTKLTVNAHFGEGTTGDTGGTSTLVETRSTSKQTSDTVSKTTSWVETVATIATTSWSTDWINSIATSKNTSGQTSRSTSKATSRSTYSLGPSKSRTTSRTTSWNITNPTGALVTNIPGPNYLVSCMDISPDSKMIALGFAISDAQNDNNTLTVLRTDDGGSTWSRVTGTPKFSDRVKSLKFSRDGQYLALMRNDTEPHLMVYRTSNWSSVAVPDIGYLGFCLDWSPDGNHLVVGVPSIRASMETPPDVRTNGLLFIKTSDFTIDTSIPERDESVSTLAFSPDGEFLLLSYTASGGNGYSWDEGDPNEHLRILRTSDWSTVPTPPIGYRLGGHEDISFTPDSRYVYLNVWTDDSLVLDLTKTGNNMLVNTPFRDYESGAFSPDGNLLAIMTSTFGERGYYLFNVGSWGLHAGKFDRYNSPLPPLVTHYPMLFAPNGDYLVICTQDPPHILVLKDPSYQPSVTVTTSITTSWTTTYRDRNYFTTNYNTSLTTYWNTSWITSWNETVATSRQTSTAATKITSRITAPNVIKSTSWSTSQQTSF